MDLQLTLDLLAEDLPAAQRQARSLGLTLRRGEGDRQLDFYVPHTAADGEKYLLRLRCDRYDEVAPSFQFVNPEDPEQEGPRWWPRMEQVSYARGDRGEVVFCTPGTREYHQHPSHRGESHERAAWKLARLVVLAWQYLYRSGSYTGRGV